jgi:hypothetical protein
MPDRRPVPAAAADAGPDRSDGGADADPDETDDDPADESRLRTATRLLRLVKVALGVLVSLLTALKLLGFLALGA